MKARFTKFFEKWNVRDLWKENSVANTLSLDMKYLHASRRDYEEHPYPISLVLI